MYVHVIKHPQAAEIHAYATARTYFLRARLASTAWPGALNPLLLPLPGAPLLILPGLPLSGLSDVPAHAAYTYALRDIGARHHTPVTKLNLSGSVAYSAPPAATVLLTAQGDALRADLADRLQPAAYQQTAAGLLAVTPGLTAPARDLDVLWALIP